LISFLIPFRSDDPHRLRSFKYVHDRLVEGWPDDEILVANNSDADFRISKSRNLAARAAKGDTFVFIDADSWVPKSQIERAIEITGSTGWCLPYDYYYALTEMGTETFYGLAAEEADDYYGDRFAGLEYGYAHPSAPNPEPAVAGNLVMSRSAYETVHGYDERFIGWGEEDRAIVLALETLVTSQVRVRGSCFHLWHPAPEENRFGQPFFSHNRALCNRYRQVRGNRLGMGGLVAEH
jgi:glycosyltransferase involved in cell wall biosynthesis